MAVTDVTGDVGSGIVYGLWVVVYGSDVTSDVGLPVSDVSGDVCWFAKALSDISDLLSDVTWRVCTVITSPVMSVGWWATSLLM